MENSPTPAAPAAIDGDVVIAAIRTAVLGNRQPIPQIAKALGCTERTVYMLIDRYKIPYIKVRNRRHLDPAHIGEAVLRDQANVPARPRGRPRIRKAA